VVVCFCGLFVGVVVFCVFFFCFGGVFVFFFVFFCTPVFLKSRKFILLSSLADEVL